MTPRLYIRPIGRLAPIVRESTPGPAAALAVAGRDDLLFGSAELIERDAKGVRRRFASAAELLASAGDGRTRALVERMQQLRAPVAGLSFETPRIMGVVNVTPDSFSDGGRYLDPNAAIEQALRLEAEGADILDIGGESTRPGADALGAEEEVARVLPVIEGLRERTKAAISIDTRKAEVMRRAAAAGAHIINDVSALTHDPEAMTAAAQTGLPVILMHAQGDPRTMQQRPTYADVVLDVYDALQARIEACEQAGIPRARLLVDPGIGFGKTLAHNLALLGASSIFHALGCAVVLGASRKSFIARLTGAAVDDRLAGSLAAALLGASQGVQILRVHDVAAMRQALAVWEGAQAAGTPARFPSPSSR